MDLDDTRPPQNVIVAIGWPIKATAHYLKDEGSGEIDVYRGKVWGYF